MIHLFPTKRWLTGLICVIMSLGSSAQQVNLDSLMGVWKDTQAPDSARGQALDLAIQYGYLFTNPDTAIVLASQLVELGEKLKNFNLRYSGTSMQGIAYYLKGDFVKSAEMYSEAYGLSEERGDIPDMAKAMINRALAQEAQGDYPTAIENYLSALKLGESHQNEDVMAGAQANLGNLYLSQEEYEKSIEYSKAALILTEKLKLGDRSLSPVYGNLAQAYLALKKYDEAESYAHKALETYERLGNPFGKALTLADLGNIAAGRHETDKAKAYFKEALQLYRDGGMPEGISTSLVQLAQLDLDDGAIQSARQRGEEALALARQVKSPENISPAAALLYEVYKQLNKPDQALNMYELHVSMEDSLRNQKNQKEFMRTQFQYDYDKKVALAAAEQDKKDAIAKKELQRQKEVRNAFMGGFAIVLLFAGVVLSQRNKIKKGKALSDSLLLNILPEEVAEELKVHGKAEARHFEEVTVMFTDFKGFTGIAEHMTPDELVQEIHTCFKAFDEIISKYNIEKIKTIGDSYMCAGGLPSANTSHARDILNAALEMRAFMQAHMAERSGDGKTTFEMRIGIHTGPVVAGIVGVKKFAYDIWGNTVNLASRMESSGEPGKINISGQTYELVKDQFACTFRGKIEARNVGQVDMYFVEGPIPQEGPIGR